MRYFKADGNITDQDDPAAYYIVVTEYDDQKRPIHQESKIISTQILVCETTWTYQSGGKVAEETTKFNENGSFLSADKSVKDKNGNQVEYTLYEQPGVASYWCENKYDANNKLVESKNFSSDGSRNVSTYRADGTISKTESWTSENVHLLSLSHENGETSYSLVEYPDGRRQEWWYSAEGTTTAEKHRDTDGSSFEKTYNSKGDLTKLVSYAAGGNVTYSETLEYHANGNLKKKDCVYDNGLKEEMLYNESGICIQKTSDDTDSGKKEVIKYTDAGVMESKVTNQPDGTIVEEYYDISGKQTQQVCISPDGSQVTFRYNLSGTIMSETYLDAEGNLLGIRQYTYNSINQLIKETYSFGTGGFMETYYNNSEQPYRECIYNSAGKMTSETVRTYYPSGFTQTSKEYDADRNCTFITYYENGPVQERLEYTADGNLTEKQCNQPDLSGYIEEYYENGLVKTLFVYGPNYDYTEETQYTYRDDGTLKTAKVIDKKTWAYEIIEYAEDGKTQVKVTKYDANDNVIG